MVYEIISTFGVPFKSSDMKKFTILALALAMFSLTTAQREDAIDALKKTDKIQENFADSAFWDWGGILGAQFGQTALVNWSQGGNSQLAVNFSANTFANFRHKKHAWDNLFIGNWGLNRFKGQVPQINTNLLELNSMYGYRIKEMWFLTTLMNFRSQFTWGFDYPDGQPKVLNSKFGAPAFMKLALGFDYKPNELFSLFLSPAAGKFTFVREDFRIDETRFGVQEGQIFRGEFGALMRAQLRREVVKNVKVFSVLEIFNNYTDPNKPNRKNFDVDWQTGFDMKINNWLSASIFLHVIYDEDIRIPVDRSGDGVPDGFGPRTQFRQVLTVGLSYKFDKKKKEEE
jgi:hypothetical protein